MKMYLDKVMALKKNKMAVLIESLIQIWREQKEAGSGPTKYLPMSVQPIRRATMLVQQRDVKSRLIRVLRWSDPNLSNQMASYKSQISASDKNIERMMAAVLEPLQRVSIWCFLRNFLTGVAEKARTSDGLSS